MTKEEFLQILRGKISGKMDPTEVNAQLDYYASYIDALISGGKTEQEAVGELGDPVLIAKTLGNAVKGGYLDSDYQYDAGTAGEQSSSGSSSAGGNTYQHYSYSEQSYTKTKSSARTGTLRQKWNEWTQSEGFNRAKAIAVLVIALLAAIACIVLFFVACFHVGGCIVGGLFPIIIAVVIIGLLFSLFRR